MFKDKLGNTVTNVDLEVLVTMIEEEDIDEAAVV